MGLQVQKVLKNLTIEGGLQEDHLELLWNLTEKVGGVMAGAYSSPKPGMPCAGEQCIFREEQALLTIGCAGSGRWTHSRL